MGHGRRVQRATPNVTSTPRTYDAGTLYAAHRPLLVPSRVEDAFLRVIIEARPHILTSAGADRGGIPEAIGDGGIVMPSDNPNVTAVRPARLLESGRCDGGREAG
ncbi:hypothetical protein [Streptomyces melanogenes]|uniref:hypothetical protein n=1 Tax=Streptomyces melanogenes TaxID=67326 RepID=UPI0037A48576